MVRKTKTLTKLELKDYIEPEGLHNYLRVIPTHEIAFPNEKSMRRYRAMLYTVNKQGTYRYRTLRSEGGLFAIMIWRMK